MSKKKSEPQVPEISSSNYGDLGKTVRKGTQDYFNTVKSGKSETPQKIVKKVIKRKVSK